MLPRNFVPFIFMVAITYLLTKAFDDRCVDANLYVALAFMVSYSYILGYVLGFILKRLTAYLLST